jgi:hypothetical protein
MHIITLMDYHTKNEITMCKAWICFAKRFNPHASITIFYTQNLSEIRKYAARYSNISFKKIFLHYPIQNSKQSGWIHPYVQELQLSLWWEIQRLHITSFIYIDADALVLNSLDTWETIMNDKPYIAIGERYIESHLLFNAGVFSYHSKNKFVTLTKLIKQYKINNNQILLPAGQQGLINMYFNTIHYDWSHPHIGYEYNTLANYCDIKKIDDKEVIVYSGKYPILRSIKNAVLNKYEWQADWIGWASRKRVKILHAFGGKGFKFWELRECKPLWDYCIKKFNEN